MLGHPQVNTDIPRDVNDMTVATNRKARALYESQPKAAPAASKPAASKPAATRSDSQPKFAADGVDVMLSINVASMKDGALKLKKYLIDQGYTVWCCLDIPGGAQFDDEISRNTRDCKVFLPLMNTEWANSKPCKEEYTMARSLFKEDKKFILPIAFSDLNWDAHLHILPLKTNTQFIVHGGTTFSDASATQATFQSIKNSLKQLLGR